MSGLVLPHLNYPNVLLTGMPKTDLIKFQKLQNFAARVVKGMKKHQSVSAQLRDLHWLPVQQRINHNVASLVFKCLHKQAPSYLSNLLLLKDTSRENLRRNMDYLNLQVPITKCRIFGDMSFIVYGPRLWNTILYSVRNSKDINSFKNKLKTHIFDIKQ